MEKSVPVGALLDKRTQPNNRTRSSERGNAREKIVDGEIAARTPSFAVIPDQGILRGSAEVTGIHAWSVENRFEGRNQRPLGTVRFGGDGTAFFIEIRDQPGRAFDDC